MADMDKRGESKTPEGPSALHEALVSKVQGKGPDKAKKSEAEGPSPYVTPFDIGSVPAEEESILSQPLSIGGPSFLDRAVFCRQFATMIDVGIPVLKALQMLVRRTHNRRMRQAIEAAAKGVEEGQPIHQSMRAHVKVFSPLVVNIIRIGEIGGILEPSLVRLAEIMESKARIRRQIVSACMYPLVALCVAILVVGVIMVKAIPIFSEVYRQTGQDLPTPTRFIMGLSSFLVHGWPVLLVLAVLLGWGFVMWKRTPSGRRFLSLLALRTPVLKGVNQKITVARTTRALGGLVAAGIPLIESLAIAADNSENLIVADALRGVHDEVEKGGRMTRRLEQANIFPPVVCDMIGIGEETGTLDRMLAKVADIYDVEVTSVLNGLATIIEPVLIVLLGGVVVFIALAVLLPYFNMAKIVGG